MESTRRVKTPDEATQHAIDEVKLLKYHYADLNNPEAEIRLLNLEPGCFNDPICATLSHVLIYGATSYNAISYTWGDPNQTIPISIDGLQFPVTTNLESALRHLRHNSDACCIWIDAICINQANIPERNQQVRLMGSIYADADRIQVWLGPETDDSPLAMQYLGPSFRERFEEQEASDAMEHNSCDNQRSTRILLALISLFNRTWWRRAWIIQEVSCRKSILIHCGHSRRPWTDLMLLWEDAHRTLLSRIYAGAKTDLQLRNDHLWTKLNSSMLPVGLLSMPWVNQKFDLETCLYMLKEFDTSDPRDKLWIAYLLCEQGSGELLVPRYDWSLLETYFTIVAVYLSGKGHLSILGHCVFQSDSDLPSWVPDWRKPRTVYPLEFGHDRKFSASKDSKIFFDISQEVQLQLKGYVVDTVQHFRHLRNARTVVEFEEIREAEAEIGQIYHWTAEPPQEVLARVLCADLKHKTQEAFSWLRATQEQRSDRPLPADYQFYDVNGEWTGARRSTFLQDLVSRIDIAMNGRIYFVSTRKYVGLVPEAAEKDDMICIFLGGKTPFVVRPIGDQYLLVGECYVHGIMDGEAMDMFQEERREAQEFVLI